MNELEQAVIDAAREVNEYDRWVYGDPVDHTAHESARKLDNAIRDLDQSLQPDPWKLLDAVRDVLNLPSAYWNTGNIDAIGHKIDRALEWRREHE